MREGSPRRWQRTNALPLENRLPISGASTGSLGKPIEPSDDLNVPQTAGYPALSSPMNHLPQNRRADLDMLWACWTPPAKTPRPVGGTQENRFSTSQIGVASGWRSRPICRGLRGKAALPWAKPTGPAKSPLLAQPTIKRLDERIIRGLSRTQQKPPQRRREA